MNPASDLQMDNLIGQEAEASLQKIKSKLGTKGLFIDCGANLGQGCMFFSNSYPFDFYDYILIEPNPFCIPRLKALRAAFKGNMEIIEQAVGIEDGIVHFYGIAETADQTTPGGSIVKSHNNRHYTSQDALAISVKTFSFSELLTEKQKSYSSIIVKMDIEGAGCLVLEDLIAKGAHKYIDFLYIEFHSHYLKEPESSICSEREKQIVIKLHSEGIGLQLWK